MRSCSGVIGCGSMPTAFTLAEPAGLIGTPSGEKFTGVVSGRASAAGGDAGSGSAATASGSEGSGAAGDGRSSQKASAPTASSAAIPAPQGRWCCVEESNQVLVTVQMTVWVERGHEVAWQ